MLGLIYDEVPEIEVSGMREKCHRGQDQWTVLHGYPGTQRSSRNHLASVGKGTGWLKLARASARGAF